MNPARANRQPPVSSAPFLAREPGWTGNDACIAAAPSPIPTLVEVNPHGPTCTDAREQG